MRYRGFKFMHNPEWMWSPEHARNLAAIGVTAGATSEQEGGITVFDHPFGTHVVVSAFGGENIYTLMVTGGHAVDAVVVVQRCDSPLEVSRFEVVEVAFVNFLGAMSHKDGERSLRVVVKETFELILAEAAAEARLRAERKHEQMVVGMMLGQKNPGKGVPPMPDEPGRRNCIPDTNKTGDSR